MTRTLIDLGGEHVEEAAAVLARAFRDNPGVRAILHRQPSEVRQRIFERLSRAFVEAARRHGLATGVLENERIAGATLAYPPGGYPLPLLAQLSIARAAVASAPRMAWRFAHIDGYMRKKHLRRPHYYLFMIGVDPAEQGKGHGGLLLRRLNELADSARIECYLETDRQENVALYERFGYQVTTEDTLKRLDNLRLWTMTRPARA
jgi:ribosomal protein S18 acetylase RimI-like enzyme